MSFSSFTISDVLEQFSLRLVEAVHLFAAVPEAAPSPLLSAYLNRHLPTAVSINTEKANSEFLVAPVLGEIQAMYAGRVSLFSGTDWKVDPARGLTGVCDYLLCRSPVRLFIRAPVAVIMEARKDDIPSGFGQVIAGMVAAQIFNQQAGTPQPVIYGAVTTGTAWRFLKLEQNTVTLDLTQYHLEQLPKILGILISMVAPEPATATAA